MQLIRKHSSTSNILRVELRHATTGQGLTGLDESSSGLIISTITDNEASATAYTVAASKIETIATLGTYAEPTATKCRFKAIDGTNHPGAYEVQFADARFAVASAKALRITFSGATNLLMKSILIQLDPVPANVTHLNDSSQSLTDLKDFADTGYDPSTHKVQGVVLVDNTAGHFIWIDPDNGTPGGDGSVSDPVDTFAAAYALGTNIRMVPTNGTSALTMPTITLTNGLNFDINGWTVDNWEAVTFTGFERIYSTVPGGLMSGGTITMSLSPFVKDIRIACTELKFHYAYFENVSFVVTSQISLNTHAFPVKTYFYYCTFAETLINLSSAYKGTTGVRGHQFYLMGCYGDTSFSNLGTAAGSVGTEVFHYGWGAATVSGTGGVFNFTSHVEVSRGSGPTYDLVSEATPWNTAWDAEVQGECFDALAEFLWAGIEIGSVTGLNVADITDIKEVTGKLDTGLQADGDNWQFTVGMLELGPSGGGGGSGTGARTVAITINDGATVLQNATVRLTEGVNTFTALTNVIGVATFNVDDATYTVAVTKAGYSYGGTTLVVDGDEAETYSMAAIVVTPPTNPLLSALSILCVGNDGQPEADVDIDIKIITVPDGDENIAYKGSKKTATSDGNGVASFEAVKGAVYEYKRGTAQIWERVTIGSGSSTDVTSFIGSP